MIALHINGEVLKVPHTVTTIAQLLQHLQLEQKVLVVEYNEHILEKCAHDQTRVSDGDRLEIVHFVGGG